MNFVNKTKNKLSKEFFNCLASEVFCFLRKSEKYDFDLVIISLDEITRLNRKYRKINKATDILSFELKDKYYLGQIFICLDQIKKQAKENNILLKKELAEVFIHGLLHLFGFDDKTVAGYEKMKKTQSVILKKIKCDKFLK